MIKKYFTSGFRSLRKNGSYTLINIAGLSLGITCSILIFLIINFELGFDAYHPAKDDIYRVVAEYANSDKPGYNSGSTYPLPVALRNDFPDLKHVAFIDRNLGKIVNSVYRDDGSSEKFKESNVCFVDPDYFKMFHYSWIAGNQDALKQEKTVVITESIARKYFNDEPALGKTIRFNNRFDVTVTGVVKDPPLNSDFPFVIFYSSNLGADNRAWDNWGATATGLNCYVQLAEGSTKEDFDNKLRGWHVKYYTGEMAESAASVRFFLQPLSELHFDSRFSNYNNRVVSYLTLLTLGLIGSLLLLTACINFVNISTVLIVSRAREAGIRKVLGSTRTQITFQFLGETLLISCIALVISLGLVDLSLITLTPVLGYNLEFHVLSEPVTLIFLIALPVFITLLAGLYPALRLSSFRPIQALKSKLSNQDGSGLGLRRGLIVFQLVTSQALIIATLIIIHQLNHFTNAPLGISSTGIVEFEIPENRPEQVHALTGRLITLPGVQHVTTSNSGSISGSQWSTDFEVTLNNEIVQGVGQLKFTDDAFLETYGITLLTGSNLLPLDTANRFLVNEEFVRFLGLTDNREAIGLRMKISGVDALISGVVKDFHTKSLHQKMDPVVIMSGTRNHYVGATRINTENMDETLAGIRKVWEGIYPAYVFEPVFLDEKIAGFYKAEKKNSYLVAMFATIAILVGCIGLYGLISFMAKNKTKEIGIRKTLGASVQQIIGLFSKEFIILTGISFAIAAPLTYYAMEQWLSNFAYRIHQGIGTFSLSLAAILVIVVATIGFKSYRAATANPVNALRDE